MRLRLTNANNANLVGEALPRLLDLAVSSPRKLSMLSSVLLIVV